MATIVTARPHRPRVVVGVDGSKCSIAALRWAARLAEMSRARVDAVIAWTYPFAAVAMPDWDPKAGATKALRQAVTVAFEGRPPAGMLQRTVEGRPASVLLDASANAVALVVGSRGRGGFAGLALGSVSAQRAKHASCPVLVVHGADTSPPAR